METCVPPGFRFHPTEEELVGYYLSRKVNDLKIDLDVIIDVDLYRIEPWDIQDKCSLGYEQQKEWYFFSYKDRKYPTGTRTNRATAAGFWKATGRDKAVLCKDKMIGMRKTLVFYKGRAPNGRKTDWIMHEYRLQSTEPGPPQEEGWVVCRAFKKPSPNHKQTLEPWNNNHNNDNSNNIYSHYKPPSFPTTNNFDLINQATNLDQHPFLQDCRPFDQNSMMELPKLDSPSVSTSFAANDCAYGQDIEEKRNLGEQYSDWKSFDKLLACQAIEFPYPNMALLPHDENHISNVLECFSDL